MWFIDWSTFWAASIHIAKICRSKSFEALLTVPLLLLPLLTPTKSVWIFECGIDNRSLRQLHSISSFHSFNILTWCVRRCKTISECKIVDEFMPIVRIARSHSSIQSYTHKHARLNRPKNDTKCNKNNGTAGSGGVGVGTNTKYAHID